MRRTALTLVIAADAAALGGLLPSLRQVVRGVGAPHAWLARAGTDGACAHLAAAGVWLVAVRVAVGLLAAALAGAPGLAGHAAGRAAATVSRVALPALVRRALAGTAGLGLVLTPLTAGAATPAAAPSAAAPSAAAPSAARAAVPLPAPVWPGTAADPVRGAPLPAPAWPVVPAPHHRPGAPRGVAVRPGDSLWLLAARRLGPAATDRDVAAAWPRWYRHNRTVIGPDPRHLVPGQVLVPPPDPIARTARPEGS